jgi:hypothetical protein
MKFSWPDFCKQRIIFLFPLASFIICQHAKGIGRVLAHGEAIEGHHGKEKSIFARQRYYALSKCHPEGSTISFYSYE